MQLVTGNILFFSFNFKSHAIPGNRKKYMRKRIIKTND